MLPDGIQSGINLLLAGRMSDDSNKCGSLDFEHLVNQHYRALYLFAYSLTRREEEACDLTQQTFFVWATKGHQLRDPSKVKSWLFRTLHREFLNSRRHMERFPHVELSHADDLPSISPAVADQMDAATVIHTLAEVDETYQVPLALFYLQDHSYKEIADTLEIPIGTVMSRIARGKVQLGHILSKRTSPTDGKTTPSPSITKKEPHG